MRRIIPAALAVALLVAGCGNSEAGLDGVKVKGDKSPSLSVDKGFKTTKTTTKVLTKGKGEKVVEGDVVTVDYVAVNGRTGKTFDNSYKAGKPMSTPLKTGSILPGFIKSLSGKKVGSRLLVAIPPKDGFGQGQQQLDIKATDTLVFLFDIVKSSKIPAMAAGKAQKAPDTLPKLVLNGDKQPTEFEKTSNTAAKNKVKKGATVVIQGDGPVIKAGQTLSMHYVGQIYPTGKVFDKSWGGEPMVRPIGTNQLIKCWDELIPGQKVGSRLILTCPSNVAYGDKKDDPNRSPDIKAGDTLIFAVDLLAAF